MSRYETPPTVQECDCAFGSSHIPAPFFGVALEQGIGRRIWFTARVQYTDRSGDFDAGRDETIVSLDPQGPRTHTAHSTMELDHATLDVGAGVKFMPLRIAKGLNGGVILGPSLGFVMKGGRSWYKHLTPTPRNAWVDGPWIEVRDDGATLVMAEDLPVENMKGWRASMRMGIALDLEWASDRLISPWIAYDLGLTPVIHEGERLNTLMIGLDVAWSL